MIEDIPPVSELEEGASYHRWSLHDEYGGNRYSGISPTGDHPYIFIFTGESGKEHGYKDEFRGDTFIYTGEGREGDMSWNGGNKAIRDHREEGNELHLFENDDEAWCVTYVGQFECTDWFYEQLPDTSGKTRKAIRFKLEPVENEITVEASDLDQVDSETLYERAQSSTERNGGETSSTRKTYSRSKAVKEYALRVADGVCIGCDEDAPFQDEDGEPFLEVHHLYRRSDGGPDHPDNVVALCPNCHRRVHHGQDGESFNQELIAKVED